jgi:hypothetical protein
MFGLRSQYLYPASSGALCDFRLYQVSAVNPLSSALHCDLRLYQVSAKPQVALLYPRDFINYNAFSYIQIESRDPLLTGIYCLPC